MNPLSLVFFGSGPVAKASLGFLSQHFVIEAIITKPSTEEQMTEAAPTARILTASDEKDVNKLVSNNAFKSQLGIVVDFGIIVERSVIDSFSLGILNSHFSLLPQWRGADPISFAILSGQPKTGVSLMLINEELDEGNLIAQQSLRIDSKVTTPDLTNQLVGLSNAMLLKNIPAYVSGQLQPYTQGLTQTPTYSRKLTKQDGVIDWSKPAVQIEREVRAYSGWPRSRASLGKYDVIISDAVVVDNSGIAGTWQTSKNSLVVFCGEQALNIKRLQPVGKKDMPIQAFLAGHKL